MSPQYYSLDKPITSSLGTGITGHCYGKGLISSLYDLLIPGSDESSNHKLRQWKEDIGDEITTRLERGMYESSETNS